MTTESRLAATSGIDGMDTLAALTSLHQSAAGVHAAVRAVLGDLVPVVNAYVEAIAGGGFVHYFGAGTSGRIAAMDAAELPPTFGLTAGQVVAHLAGGPNALLVAVEGAEDDAVAGAAAAADVSERDLAIGLTASGSTPFVLGALRACAAQGAKAVLITNSEVPAPDYVDMHVHVATGPEPIAGSTRMNAATAQKLVLNAVSSVAAVNLGRTHSNLMIALRPTNAKLRARLVAILAELTGKSDEECRAKLVESGMDGRVALLSLLTGRTVQEASTALALRGSTRDVLHEWAKGST